ncbi:flagellar biosynthesis protein [Clostridium hydrogenum]|uniref:flagellar biosynthesis protein n=1 Tax=Clostridium hydrogenum TaxID=2855764 RepID=UPI001F1B4475|nr:flagellar biosynthesis protein [Clostridium hydrogenum]
MKKDKNYYISLLLCFGGIFFLIASIASKKKLPNANILYFICCGFFALAAYLSYNKNKKQ